MNSLRTHIFRHFKYTFIFSGYELLFRAGQSDTDPISLEDLDNQSLEKVKYFH